MEDSQFTTLVALITQQGTTINKRLDAIDKRIDNLELRFTNEIQKLEQKLEYQIKKSNREQTELSAIILQQVGESFVEFSTKTKNNFSQHAKRITKLESIPFQKAI